VAAAKIVPLQQMIVMAKNQLAGANNSKMSAPCENFPIALKSSVAPMSPTTQQVQHSPNRRIKSMPFGNPIDIKVIYFWPMRPAG
jgi:hypothetical protein